MGVFLVLFDPSTLGFNRNSSLSPRGGAETSRLGAFSSPDATLGSRATTFSVLSLPSATWTGLVIGVELSAGAGLSNSSSPLLSSVETATAKDKLANSLAPWARPDELGGEWFGVVDVGIVGWTRVPRVGWLSCVIAEGCTIIGGNPKFIGVADRSPPEGAICMLNGYCG